MPAPIDDVEPDVVHQQLQGDIEILDDELERDECGQSRSVLEHAPDGVLHRSRG